MNTWETTRDIKLFHRLVVRVGLVKTGKAKKAAVTRSQQSSLRSASVQHLLQHSTVFFLSFPHLWLLFIFFKTAKCANRFPFCCWHSASSFHSHRQVKYNRISQINIAHHFHLLNFKNRNQTTFSTIAQLVDVLLSGFERSQQNGNDPATVADAVSHRIARRSCCQHRNREHHFATYFT